MNEHVARVVCAVRGHRYYTVQWAWGGYQAKCSRCGYEYAEGDAWLADALPVHPDHPDFQEQWR